MYPHRMEDPPPRPSAERIELETKIGFLERTVEALNDVILEQGQTLERFARSLASLEARLGSATEAEESDPLLERPPHY